jgi:hypothetical protein
MSQLLCEKALLAKGSFNCQMLYERYAVYEALSTLRTFLTKWIIDGLLLAVPRVDDRRD